MALQATSKAANSPMKIARERQRQRVSRKKAIRTMQASIHATTSTLRSVGFA